MNDYRRGGGIFLGRSDPPIELPCIENCRRLVNTIGPLKPLAVYSSPLGRCRQTLDCVGEAVELPPATLDGRLVEINYGSLEGLTVTSARAHFTEFFERLAAGLDPRFPEGGENTDDVSRRVQEFAAERWAGASEHSLTCTHNVVLRCLLGEALGVPREHWYRLQIPHLEPFVFVQTREHGLFVDVPQECMRHVFQDFAIQLVESTCRS